jgi:hypothetical protein
VVKGITIMLQNLIIHNNKAVCPRCDGNGFLYMTTLQPLNISVIVCDECEALWPSITTSITNVNFKDFTTYVQQYGYTYNEISLTKVNYDWLKQSEKYRE